jgi:hypothetical protein
VGRVSMGWAVCWVGPIFPLSFYFYFFWWSCYFFMLPSLERLLSSLSGRQFGLALPARRSAQLGLVLNIRGGGGARPVGARQRKIVAHAIFIRLLAALAQSSSCRRASYS